MVPDTDETGLDTPNTEAIDALGSAVPVRGMTARASVPTAPNGLVAEQARNSNLTGTSNRGVLLLWNAPDDPTGDDLDGYVIARKVDDGDWDDEWMEIRESDPRTYLTDNTLPLPTTGEMRYYRVAAFNSTGTGAFTDPVRYLPDTTHNHAPMAGADVAAQTVTAGGTVMVQSTITDPDMGDMLDWTVSVDPSDGSIATAEVDNMGMVTITGVAAGSATITVTATDAAGEPAMQTIMVTVGSANTPPMAGDDIAAQMVPAGRHGH